MLERFVMWLIGPEYYGGFILAILIFFGFFLILTLIGFGLYVDKKEDD